MKMPAWSFSSLTNYETCPRRYYLTRVTKEVKEEQNEAATWGDRVHKALEARIRDKAPLPDGMGQYEEMVQVFTDSADDWFCERQYALDADFRPCEWFAPEAWVRGIIDLGRVSDDVGMAFDWKTGKVKPTIDQLQLFAALMFHTHRVDRVKTGYVWLQFNETTPKTYRADDLSEIWKNFIPRVMRMEKSFETDKWVPKPSGLCKGWCPCTGCEFNGRRK